MLMRCSGLKLPLPAAVFAAAAALITALPGDPRQPKQPHFQLPQLRPRYFTKYCVTCHNAKLKTGGFVLDTADSQHVGDQAEQWEKVVRKLRTQAMPPARMPRPDEATYDSTAAWLETELDRASAEQPEAGQTAAPAPAEPHRIRERHPRPARPSSAPKEMDYSLLLPADNSSSGFDNIADLLFVSPTAMESYIDAARKISRLAVGDPTMPVMVNTYRLSGEHPQDDPRRWPALRHSRRHCAVRSDCAR